MKNTTSFQKWMPQPPAVGGRIVRPLALLGALLFAGTSSQAALLKSAEVTAVVNDVKFVDPVKGERPAGVNDVVRGSLGLKTGVKSRAELLFQDKTLTRLGANTLFSFNEGTRDLELERGTMLLQVPKNAGGAKIRTAAVTAAITGTTILLEYSPVKWKPRRPAGVSPDVALMTPEKCLLELQSPKRRYAGPDLAELRHKAALAKKAAGHVKVIVLEGTLRLFLNQRLGESTLINPGQMIILNPTARSIPPPVNFDIAQLAKTSLLVNNRHWSGGETDMSMAMVQEQIAQQTLEKNRGELIETNLVILGGGTQVLTQVEQSASALGAMRQPQNVPAPPPASPPSDPGFTLTLSGPTSTLPPNLFDLEGSTTSIASGALPPATSPAVSGNAVVTSTLAGAVPVLPTEGSDFVVYSTGGVAGNAANRTATKATRTFTFAPAAPGESQALSFDYRFLTDEINTGSSMSDRATIKISNGTESIELAIDRDILQPSPSASLTPVAGSGVGGFRAGTDWLPFTIDLAPFLGGNATVTFLVWDVGGSEVDSALAIDNLRTGDFANTPPGAAVPGTLTLNLNSVVLGDESGGFRVPNLEGLPARNGTGEAANAGTFNVNAPNGITLNSPLNISTGLNGNGTTYGGRGGTVSFNSTNELIAVRSTVKVSESSTTAGKASRAGGKIALNSGKTSGLAINISNTGELLALLNAAAPGPGGRIEITSAGGDVSVSGKVIADRGTVEVRNNGASGLVHINAAQIAGDIVKIGALGTSGQLTITAGSQLTAATTLRLYGGTGVLGKVLFNGSGTVNLKGGHIDIRARTVEISGATNVNNQGPTGVHAGNHNYNPAPGDGGGRFRNPISQTPVSGAPPFD